LTSVTLRWQRTEGLTIDRGLRICGHETSRTDRVPWPAGEPGLDFEQVPVSGAEGGFLLDARQPVELVVESVTGAVNIPHGQLRSRLGELPR
jgi:hypothetical protein